MGLSISGFHKALTARWGRTLAASLVVAGGLLSAEAQAGPTLDKITQRGTIKAGVGTTPGFFSPDSNGRWQGFFVDIGRAIAIATLGNQDKIEFTVSSPQQRLPALQAGEFDILLSGVTVTITRAFKLGFHFGPTVFYDGQGILVRKDLGVTKAADLEGATIGVQSGTTGELNIADFFRRHGKSFKALTIEDTRQFNAALEEGRVDAITQDSSDLVGKRKQLKNPENYVLLPERLSKEPLAPAVAGGDDRWLELVNWSVNALIQAEEWGITSANVDEFLKSEDPAIRRFLGVDPSVGEAIGLDPKWAYNIVKTLGNYGELFDRHLKPLGWERGYNNLWTNGGLLYSPPFR
ncbi:general L-amino acid transport system substrate-binding protein [Pseudochelatococcus lubricantis]|uniref:General L-amino acid transport system substrate-binding protein n=1 Tax=Pseudochelatococcus lubricantis TaxID=1538102 RepID=A0ABX0V1A0_9HYPH|nr:amino acid ABC transporter substrate-binding protein [Pseudochelatococcus lubricantis]NIJ58982.1 general L-amino acid transport system substrate-binding protein [Pseudochelatococcus lubricantis]